MGNAAALSVTLAVVAAAAAFERLLTGSDARARLEQLRQPAWAPSFAVWVAFGTAFFLIYGFIAFRLLAGNHGGEGSAAFGLVIAIFAANALWNFLFLRRRQLGAGAWMLVPYVAFVLFLFVLLLRLDRTAAWALIPYILYLPYLLAWSFVVSRRNS